MNIVVNTTPIISLACVGHLDLFEKLFGKIIITQIKPLLDEMIEKGRWYSNSVYRSFLTQAGEL